MTQNCCSQGTPDTQCKVNIRIRPTIILQPVLLHGPAQAQGLDDLVTGTCTDISQPCQQGPYRGEAVGGTGMFAGLNGGDPAERVIALAARALDSPAGVSCSWEGHTKMGF